MSTTWVAGVGLLTAMLITYSVGCTPNIPSSAWCNGSLNEDLPLSTTPLPPNRPVPGLYPPVKFLIGMFTPPKLITSFTSKRTPTRLISNPPRPPNQTNPLEPPGSRKRTSHRQRPRHAKLRRGASSSRPARRWRRG